MSLSINDWGDFGHDPAVVVAVVAEFTRCVKREQARGRNLRHWSGGVTVYGRRYDGKIDLGRRLAEITRK